MTQACYICNRPLGWFSSGHRCKYCGIAVCSKCMPKLQPKLFGRRCPNCGR